MTHPLVAQLYFTRSEFQRGLQDITNEEACRRFVPMNCISWIIGHLAFQENTYWMVRAQEKDVAPELQPIVGWDQPATTPSLDEMWAAWHTVTEASAVYLESLTSDTLESYMIVNGQPFRESVGSMLRRVTYHYWYHLGEAQAIRQLLGHTNLPDFVGAIHAEAPYVAEG